MRFVLQTEPPLRKKSANKTPGKENVPENQLPNSLIMRIMQDEAAEREADALSKGVSSLSEEDLKAEMGQRLVADFSTVKFHSDTDSRNRSNALGARAWARGSDVYFGRGGFAPEAAAHELVHTVQQNAVRGNVSASVPYGAVQLLPEKGEDEDDAPRKNGKDKDVDLEQMMNAAFNTEYGRKVYKNIESPLKKLIQKGAGNKIPGYTQTAGIQFLAMAADQDYSARGILSEIVQRPMEPKSQARDRLYEYKQFIQFIGSRLGDFRLEDLAMKTNLINRTPKYDHKGGTGSRKRAYETEKAADNAEAFNPNHEPELKAIQDQIDGARTAKEAYQIFTAYTGNANAKIIDSQKNMQNVTPELLKNKLKHMTRVIFDYPELRNNIGDLNVVGKESKDTMATTQTVGLHQKAPLYYNAFLDSDDPEAVQKRQKYTEDMQKNNYSTGASLDTVGTHELGHVLSSTLNEAEGMDEATWIQNRSIVEHNIIDFVFRSGSVISPDEYIKLRRFKQDGKFANGKKANAGQIKMHKNGFMTNGLTSLYGTDSPAEFFAEAFHDVYSHGSSARKASVEVVKEYENRQKRLTKKRFFKKKAGILEKFMNFIRMI